MSLAPIPTGLSSRGKLDLLPGWAFDIDDYNMDVLTCSVGGKLSDILANCPDKYQTMGPQLQAGIITFPGLAAKYAGIAGLSCCSRKIIPGEGLSAVANLEFKGYLSGTPRVPLSALTWLSASYPVTFGTGVNTSRTITFIGPSQAQLTLKFGTTGAFQTKVGQSGNPPGSDSIPNTLEVYISTYYPTTPYYGLLLYASTPQMICTKDDSVEAGSYFERTQVWMKGYFA